jgi:hypothetical protein
MPQYYILGLAAKINSELFVFPSRNYKTKDQNIGHHNNISYYINVKTNVSYDVHWKVKSGSRIIHIFSSLFSHVKCQIQLVCCFQISNLEHDFIKLVSKLIHIL